MAFNEVLARLSVVLGMDTAAFSTGSARAKKEVSTLERSVTRASRLITAAVTTMLGSFVVDQIVRVTKAGLEYASSLGETAAQLGVTTKALQEYRYAASQAGIEQDQMDQALSQLTRRLGDAAAGAKEPAKALEKLGISVRDANGHVRDAGDVIPLIADGLQKLESPAERAAVLVDLFGKAGQKLAPLLEGGAAGVNNLRNAAHELGIVLSDKDIQNADDTADKLSAMKQVLEAKIAGVVAENADAILALVDAFTKLIVAAGNAVTAWKRWRSAQDDTAKAQDPGYTGSLFTIRRKTEIPTTTRTVTMRSALGETFTGTKEIRLPKGGRGGGRLPFGAAGRLQQNPKAVGGSAFGGLDLSQFAPGSGARGWMTAANDQFAGIAAKSKEAETAVANMANVHGPKLVASIKKAKPELENLRSATQSILDRLFPETAEVNRYREELATLTAALKAGQLTTEDYAKAVDALRQEFTGFAELIAQNQEIVAEGVGTTLDDALDAATASWDRFADGLSDRSDVTRVEVVKNFDQMAQDVLSSLGQLSGAIRGGGFLDILSGVLGLGLQVAGLFRHNPNAFKTPTPPVINNFRGPAYANGTSFHRGGLAVVGERGPELVNLPRGVGVTPNKDLRGMGGGIAEIVPSKYFDVVVDGRIVRASPAIMDGSAKVTTSRLGRRQKRQLYG